MQKELLKGVGAVALGLALATGIESNENTCIGPWRLAGKENPVFICKNEEGRVFAQGKHTPERVLPEFVTSIYGVWCSWNGQGEKVGFYNYEDHYYLTYEMDLESGEVKNTGSWFSPYP